MKSEKEHISADYKDKVREVKMKSEKIYESMKHEIKLKVEFE